MSVARAAQQPQPGSHAESAEGSRAPQGLMREAVKRSLTCTAEPSTVPARCFKTRPRTNTERGRLDPSSQCMWAGHAAPARRP